MGGGGATHNEDHSVGLRNLSSDVCFANVASFGHPVPLPGRQLAPHGPVYFSKQSSMFLFIYLVTWISSDSPLLACVPSINNKTSKKSNNIFQDSRILKTSPKTNVYAPTPHLTRSWRTHSLLLYTVLQPSVVPSGCIKQAWHNTRLTYHHCNCRCEEKNA